jgi:ketosteroid isomerase-like protein
MNTFVSRLLGALSISIIVALSARLLLLAQAPGTSAEVQVLATDDRRTEALRRGDVATLQQIYADDYSLVTPAGVVTGKANQISGIATGQGRVEKIEVSERTVRIYGDVAVVLSRDKSIILNGGRNVGGDVRLTRVYKLFGADWRLIATHGSMIAQ